VVRKSGSDVAPADLAEFLAERVAKWQVPERWSFIAEVPKTSVGKFDKKELRSRHASGLLPMIEIADRSAQTGSAQ
jgi:fatty-acyl-CoA synthase